jgi:hypothetical protein
MKKKLITFMVIFFAFTLLSSAQEKYQLLLSGISMQQRQAEIAVKSEHERTLTNGATENILLYESADGLKVKVEFTPVFKGRRMKLKRTITVETPEGKSVHSRQKKAVQLLKVSVPGSMKGRDAVELLYDKKRRQSIFVKYDYKLNYN